MPRNATSLKSPAVKAAVAVKRAQGKSKAQIAREVGIDRETVTRILSDREINEAVEQSRSRCVQMFREAELAVKKQLQKGNGDLGLKFLEKSGVLSGTPPKPSVMAQDIHLQQALQIIVQGNQELVPTVSVRQIPTNPHTNEESAS